MEGEGRGEGVRGWRDGGRGGKGVEGWKHGGVMGGDKGTV